MKRYDYITVYDDVEIKVGVTCVRCDKKVSGAKFGKNRVLNRHITHIHTILLSDGKLISTTWRNKMEAVRQTIIDLALFEDLNTFNKHIMKVNGKSLTLEERIEIADSFEKSAVWKDTTDFAKYVLADGFRTGHKVTA